MQTQELENKMADLVTRERRVIREILELINLAFDQNHYLRMGHASLFDWLVKGHAYSESAAQRRIQAARLLRAVPEAADKITEGSVNLTTMAKAQSLIQMQEKSTGRKVEPATKTRILEGIQNQSQAKAEKTVFALLPELPEKPVVDRITRVSASASQIEMRAPDELLTDLRRARELLSHIISDGASSAVFAYLLKDFLKRKDPLQKKTGDLPRSEGEDVQIEPKAPTAAAKKTCVRKSLPAAIRRTVFQRAKGRCEYRDPITQNLCASTYQVQIDHIQPVAAGGSDDPENLRCLCGKHNRFRSNATARPE